MLTLIVMQGLVDVGKMGCSSLAAHSADIYQSEDTLCPSELALMQFIQNIQVKMNPLSAKNLKTNYNVVPYVDHGTEIGQ